MRPTRKCEFCGKAFVPRSGMQKYCSEECQAEAKRLRKKRQQDLINGIEPIMDLQQQEYLTFSKAAILMGCTRQYIYKLVANGKLKASRLSNRMAFVRKADIEKMFEGNPYERVIPASQRKPCKKAKTGKPTQNQEPIKGKEENEVLDYYSGEEVMRQSLAVSLGYIAEMPFNFSLLDVHMWYIYLLIGLYLYLPIFSAWVEKASERAKLWFLAAWGVTLLLPYYTEFAAPYLWGTCSWNSFGMLYYFAGFNGYLLLGHYLRNHNWTGRQLCGIGIPMFAIGYAVTFLGFRRMTSLPDFTDEMLELFFTYCSLNVVMMTIPVFMLCKRANFRSERIKKALANLTLCGFGVYMIHYFFTGPSVVLMRAIHVPIYLQIPCAAVVAFCTSWFLVAMAYRCFGKRTKWVLG